MHQCLLVEEIVQVIIAALNPFLGDSPAAHPVTQLGVTCRALYSPCMDELWHMLPTIHPLLDVFPLGMVSPRLGVLGVPRVGLTAFVILNDIDIVSLQDFISPPDRVEHWTRFRQYAKRVQSISIQHFDITPKALCLLSSHCPTPYIFPRIRQLKWYIMTYDSPLIATVFLGPTLSCLKLRVLEPLEEPVARLFHDAIVAHTRNIRILSLSYFPLGTEEILLRCLDLESVSVTGVHISSKTISHLATRPKLQRLKCTLGSTSTDLPYYRPHESIYFPSLTTLVVSSQSVTPGLITLLEFDAMSNLDRLEIFLTDAPTTNDLDRLLLCLPKHPSLAHLLIKIDFTSTDPDELGQCIGTDIIIRLLLPLANLTYIALDKVQWNLSPLCVRDLAQSWPKAKKILLGYNTAQTTSEIGIDMLGWFAYYCPDLTMLGLVVDATDNVRERLTRRSSTLVDSRGNVVEIPRIGNRRKLERLMVGASLVTNPQLVGFYLGTMYPNVQVVSRGSWVSRMVWQSVNLSLKSGPQP